MSEILCAAQSYWQKGFSIIPVKTNKKPAISNWKQYQTKGLTTEQLGSLFKEAEGIALVCGYKEIVCFDFDAQDLDKFEHEPYDIVEDFFEPFIDTATQWLNNNQYVIAKSRSGGRHLYICIEGVKHKEIDGNLKLAHIPAISKANGKETKKAFIETRGFGGYVVCPPTEGYEYLHGDLRAEKLQPIPLEFYHLLIELARNFSQVAQEEESFTQERPKERNTPNRLSVIDAFNDKYHPSEFLERHGYKLKFKGPFVNTYLAPDSTSKNAGVRLFHNQEKPMVFSHHANDPLGDGKGHDAFDCFRILEHGSNRDSAIKAASKEFSDRRTGNKASNFGTSNTARTNSGDTNKDEEKWEDIKELPEVNPPAPPLDPELIPEPLRPWLEDISIRASIPLEMPTVAALVAMGSAVGRRIGIYPKCKDDWLVVPNMWGGVVGRPGMLKSAIISEATKPLRRIEVEAWETFEKAKEEADQQVEMLELELKNLKSRFSNSLKPKTKEPESPETLKQQIVQKQEELKKLADLKPSRYITQDSTVEKFGELLRDNPNGMLLLRDELAGWLRTLDKSGREGDREFFLETWNGTGGYTFDRIGRGTVRIPAACLSVFGGIQPGKLNKYITEALSHGDGADGLLQRLQLVVWPEELPAWKNVDRFPDSKAKNKAYEIFGTLTKLEPSSFGLTPQEDEIPALNFASDAQLLFDEWRDELEIRLRSKELSGSPAFESHLSKFRSLMPSLALIFHLVDFAAYQTDSSEVSLEATRKAAVWCEYLELHAKRFYVSEVKRALLSAYILLEKIEDGDILDNSTVRDIYRCGWEGLNDKEVVMEGLEMLTEHHYIKLEEKSTKGRPSLIIKIHPKFREEEE